MCIAYISLGNPDWPLFIAANRDEFHNRPTAYAAPWQNNHKIISGLDLQGGGTWLGITHSGRFALLTNYREPGLVAKEAPTRGKLVSDFLSSDISAKQYIQSLEAKAQEFNGFNLIVGEPKQAYYLSNRAVKPHKHAIKTINTQYQNICHAIENGTHVVSNHLLNTSWPKTDYLKNAFDGLDFDSLYTSVQPVFDILGSSTKATDNNLPNTGISLELERLLSSAFIISPDYGTKCSTVIAIHKSGKAIFSEASYNPEGKLVVRRDWPFIVETA